MHVTVLVPTGRPAVLVTATPLPFNTTVPKATLLVRKMTLPVGVPPGPLTVAVKVTFALIDDGFEDDVTLLETPLVMLVVAAGWVSV